MRARGNALRQRFLVAAAAMAAITCPAHAVPVGRGTDIVAVGDRFLLVWIDDCARSSDGRCDHALTLGEDGTPAGRVSITPRRATARSHHADYPPPEPSQVAGRPCSTHRTP